MSYVHEPYCKGAHDCGGWFRCTCCGRHSGWCQGSDWDEGTCPDCWTRPEDPKLAVRFCRLEKAIERDEGGRFVSRDVTPLPAKIEEVNP